jgi:hypothetical protein
MAGRILVPDLRAFDSNGDPISGAKLYTYVTGTTTNLATYTTSALNVAQANPVVADSSGRFPDIWAPTDTAYRIVVKDASGVTINDTDPVYAQGSASSVAPRSLSSVTTLTSDDANETLFCTGSWALTLPLGSGLPAGWKTYPTNEGTGTITLTAQGGDLIAGASTKALGRATAWVVEWSGTAWHATEISAGTGRQALWIPAEAMLSRVTNGPSISVSETATNKINRRTLDFDKDTVEYVQFRLAMPKSWDEGTITFRPVWTHGSTSTNFKVSWGLQAVAISDGEDGDAAFGTAQYSNDTGGSTGFVYIGDESAAITVGGTPSAEDVVVFQVLRKADDATNDTLAVDASLIGVRLYINTDSGSDT